MAIIAVEKYSKYNFELIKNDFCEKYVTLHKLSMSTKKKGFMDLT